MYDIVGAYCKHLQLLEVILGLNLKSTFLGGVSLHICSQPRNKRFYFSKQVFCSVTSVFHSENSKTRKKKSTALPLYTKMRVKLIALTPCPATLLIVLKLSWSSSYASYQELLRAAKMPYTTIR